MSPVIPKILVKFEDNYADEFDLNGFFITTKPEWEKILVAAKKSFAPLEAENATKKAAIDAKIAAGEYAYFRPNEKEFYFGTNESLFYESFEDWFSSYMVVELTNEVAEFMQATFPYGFGQYFTDFDNYDEEFEEDTDYDDSSEESE